MKKVLVVEDEEKIAEVLTAYLLAAGYQVEWIADGALVMDTVASQQPDLIILDLMLPNITGEELCEQIRETSDLPILIITAKVQEQDMLSCLYLGADDYIIKPFSNKEVVARVHALLRRTTNKQHQQPHPFQVGEQEIRFNGTPLTLTPTELRIFTCLLSQPGRVFSRDMIIAQVFDEKEYEGFDRSLDVHIRNLRRKVEVDPSNPKWIKTKFGLGYYVVGSK
ncbi:MAG: response regulator transcription factor [Erysipelotrichaceae bacterium]